MSARTFARARRIAGALLVLAAAAALPGPARADGLDVKEVDLDNGMRVLLYRRPGDPNVAAGWVAKVGSVNERPGITGLSHLFEHMMFKGTRTIGTKDIAADLKINDQQDAIRAQIRKEQEALDIKERLGLIPDASDPTARTAHHKELLEQFDALVAKQKDLLVDNEFDSVYTKAGASNMNAFTTNDFTCYFVTLPANKLELWFWMESDRLRDPVFRQFYSERDVVWEERRMRTDSTPTGKLEEQFDTMFWMAAPYAWPVIGWPSDLNGITREEANAYFERNYSPNNLTAAIVGDFDPAEGERLAKLYFGRLKRAKEDPIAVRTFNPPILGVRRFEAEAETRPTVTVRWFTVQHDAADEPALSVLADLLNGETGRLSLSLVKGQKVASAASAQAQGHKYAGMFEVEGVAAPGHEPAEVESALYAEIKKLRDEPVGAQELQKVKNQATADKYRKLDGNFPIMIQLLIYDALGTWHDMFTETDLYLKVTPEDVQRVAQKYLRDDVRTVAVFRSKASSGPADPAWDALNPQQQQIGAQIKAQVAQAKEPAELEQALAQISGAKAGAPESVQPVLAWAEGYIKTKLDAMKAAPAAGGGK